MRRLIIQTEAMDDLEHWVESDRKTALRILRLIREAQRTPFEGTGKPERLRHFGRDVWSRRSTREHRLVYRVLEDAIDILQARYHYE